MDKVVSSPRQAVADIADGAMVAITGFGVNHGFPNSLILALREQGTRNLTIVCNSLGGPGEKAQLLVENNQARKIMAAFSVRPGLKTAAEEQIAAGKLEVEMVPQGILVERCRAGGAGIPAFYSPTAADTELAEGKDIRYFDGRAHVLEHAIHLDYALLRAYRADRAGNLQFRGGSRNFNPSFAKAARIAIVEADEIVEIGELAPETIGLPGIFVDRVVRGTQVYTIQEASTAGRRTADTARRYNGKQALTRAGISKNAARIIRDGTYVNLGTGLPTQVSNFLEGRGVWLHAENGVLGYGRIVTGKDIDPDLYNAGGQFVSPVPGTSFFDSTTSFEMARGGHIDTVVLGAYEVDQAGNLANWSIADARRGAIGGAMDLVAGSAELIIVMEHCDSKNRPKLRRQCSYPLTGQHCVNWVVTDLAMLHWVDGRVILEAVAPGFTPEEVIALTELDITVAASVRTME